MRTATSACDRTFERAIRAKIKFVRAEYPQTYVVKVDGDRIGFARLEEDGRWKAVDTYMAWTRKYKTRARAAAALLKRALAEKEI